MQTTDVITISVTSELLMAAMLVLLMTQGTSEMDSSIMMTAKLLMKSSEAAQEVLRTKCYYSPIFSITVT
jgi:hypothetical protein